ncbi:MAG: DNA repair protein RecN [Chloroflexi bacterium]|nr:DNA repair protein RecN [Chloroflexi bacterium CFX1]MCK6568745.1 DNA repair protein RecN [Anaerolineales bacterium]MCQ3954227.1 DNA repair protein RecN [Chloroflexota bacterium]MDL1920660.1 DNA repair protein RecN [Chloroflexi bacterium CFX5]NUQ59955.1 DNA repair protein RecN [Anaerolineales bacterium]
MLSELHIQNFAIIDKLDLRFGPGLIILTGETGAGKSIILDAVVMLIGGKADTTFVRTDAEAAFVEGVFHLKGPERDAVHEILNREALMDDPNYVVLMREVRREGRSVARINGRTANVGLLKEIGALLVDIHGQAEHLSLLDPRAHLGLLDRYADVAKPLNDYRQTYHSLLALRNELNSLRKAQADADRRVEMLTYQAEEIESAKLQVGEDEELKKERDRLANAESLAQNAQEALAILDEGSPDTPAASDLIGQAAQALAALAKIDAGQSEMSNQAEVMLDTLSDIIHDLRDYLEEIEFNPKRLDEVEERLDLIRSLTRKYGGSIPAVIAYGADAQKQLETITGAADRINELEMQEATLLEKLSKQGTALSEKRKSAAGKMGKGIEIELDDLRMASAQFGTDFKTRPDLNGVPIADGTRLAFDQNGFDQVEFLVAPNPGEGLKPLAKIASGGETSRLMLGLKNVMARADEVPSLIFDEIDQGIGGRVGMTVGHKLWNLSRSHQVFCVTHLPQLAVFGDQHYQVQKLVDKGRTLTRVEPLEGESRLLELSQMLGEVGEGTLRSAHELLQTARQMVKESQK